MCRSLAARCLAAVAVVAATASPLATTSAPVSAQTAERPTFSDPQLYTDVASGRDDYQQIQSLARAGVFDRTDCADGRFCPDSSVTRWQLAVWLMRSLGEDDLAPIRESRFSDVDSSVWWAPYVERAAELGFIGGCASEPLRYCPNASVDRGQAATAISRVLDYFVPDVPGADPVGFTDLESSYPHTDKVNRVVEFKIMEACNQDPLQFCRRENVTKARMAVILFESLDWLQLNSVAELSPVPGGIFLTDYNQISWYIKTQVVDHYGEDQPWLRTAWNATNTTQFYYVARHGSTSVHGGVRKDHLGNYRHETIRAMTTPADTTHAARNHSFIHELAHIYTLSNEVSSTPLALAATHLYFWELAGGVERCNPLELLATAAENVIFDRKSSYWGQCPHLPDKPTDEAVANVQAAFSGQIPEWFDETFRDEAGDLDYEELWAAARSYPDGRRRLVVYMFRDSFGGYCASHQVHQFLNRETNTLDANQPWVDGGCDDSASDASQAAGSGEDAGHIADVRIVARRLADGRIEFGLQQRHPDNTWADRQLPRVRFFPTNAGTNRWLVSSALDLAPGEVRIVARRLADGRIEFGLQQRHPDNTWADRRLPRVRFFPTSAGVNRWLVSSPLILHPADI